MQVSSLHERDINWCSLRHETINYSMCNHLSYASNEPHPRHAIQVTRSKTRGLCVNSTSRRPRRRLRRLRGIEMRGIEASPHLRLPDDNWRLICSATAVHRDSYCRIIYAIRILIMYLPPTKEEVYENLYSPEMVGIKKKKKEMKT